MANEKNLVNLKDRSQRERREIARKGAEASNKKQKERKTLREELLLLLESKNTQKKISVAIINEALEGNIKAFEVIRDTIGEKPTDKIEAELNTDINITIE